MHATRRPRWALRVLWALPLLAMGLVSATGLARAGEVEEAPASWRAQAEAEGLTASDIEILAEHKVLIGVRSYPQIFSAYAACPVPVFVTSDSVLRAYNVLLEQSLMRVERARAHELPRILRSLWDGLPTAIPADAELGVDEDALALALRRAQIAIGTALRLLGEETPNASEDVRGQIDEEARLVETGEGRRRPPWMGPSTDPLDTLDYDRFRPRSFYVGSDRLERAFRAIAWLQDLPFHVQRDDDLLTIVVLQNAFGRGRERDPALLSAHAACRAFMRRHVRFLGGDGEPSIYDHRGTLSLESTRHAFLRDLPEEEEETSQEPDRVVHVMPRLETPDGRLFGRLFEARIRAMHPEPLPDGLDLVAALGCDRARTWRTRALGEDATVPEDWPELEEGNDLFRRYLRALALLVDEPDKAAPDLFGGEAWARKSANTVLAAWAQIRHAWALAAMDSQRYFGAHEVTPGWVEPEPAFFARLVDLTVLTTAALGEAHAFDTKIGTLELMEGYRSFVERVEGLDREGRLDEGYDGFWAELETDLERRHYRRIGHRYWDRAWIRVRALLEDEGRDAYKSEEGRKRLQGMTLREEANLVKQDVAAFDTLRREDPDWPRLYGDPLRLRKRWEALQLLVHRLEGLAVKQLRGKPFDEDDANFLRGYAEKLAYPLLYDGNAFADPPRDRALVASVFSAYPPTPKPREGPSARIVHAGTGMPCAIYVLWPHEGGEVLCRGGVMPYREVVQATRITDEAWRERLRSPEAPPVPRWLEPIAGPTRARK